MKKKNKMAALTAALVLTIGFSLVACGTREKSQIEPAAVSETGIIRVTGVVGLVESDPIPEVVISGSDGEWYVAREDEHKLINYQHRAVTVEGTLTVIEMEASNGMSGSIRRTLSNITVNAIEIGNGFMVSVPYRIDWRHMLSLNRDGHKLNLFPSRRNVINDDVQVTGIVGLVENKPFANLVISGPGGEWYVAREDEHKLKDMQHRAVIVEGTENTIEEEAASGNVIRIRLILSDIVIIAISEPEDINE